MCRMLTVATGIVLLSLTASTARAQYACGSPPPTYGVPRVVRYAPAPYVVNYAPPTHVACGAPAQPCTTGCEPGIQPYTVCYNTTGWSIYGTPKVYVPGQPVRNLWRAITP